jgi:hypothetical protein
MMSWDLVGRRNIVYLRGIDMEGTPRLTDLLREQLLIVQLVLNPAHQRLDIQRGRERRRFLAAGTMRENPVKPEIPRRGSPGIG